MVSIVNLYRILTFCVDTATKIEKYTKKITTCGVNIKQYIYITIYITVLIRLSIEDSMKTNDNMDTDE